VSSYKKNSLAWLSRRHRRPHRGLMVFIVLTCLVIVTTMVFAMLYGAVRSQRQLLVERDRRQCELLLQAGADRAMAQFGASDQFLGDTWTVQAEAITGLAAGSVTSSIIENPANQTRQLHVVAEYRSGDPFAIHQSRDFSIPSITQPSQE